MGTPIEAGADVITLTVVGWLLGWALAYRMHSLPAATGTVVANITVVIPARNEADRIGRLVETLRSDGIGHIVVADDSSIDGTGDVAQRAGAQVFQVSPPPGWTGKNWACWSAVQSVDDEDVLVFLDADVEPAPGFIGRLAAAAHTSNGIVSVEPWHRIERTYERASSFVQLVTVLSAGIGGTSRTGRWRRPLAFGPALAVPKSTYERIGGHRAVRTEIAEDVALARRAQRLDIDVRAWLGGSDVRFRMYPAGPRQLLEGWTKNLSTGATAVPRLRLIAVVLWITAAVQATLALHEPSLVTGAAYAAFVLQIGWMWRKLGGFGHMTAVFYPLALGAFFALFVRSVVHTHVRRTVRWSGRSIPTTDTAHR